MSSIPRLVGLWIADSLLSPDSYFRRLLQFFSTPPFYNKYVVFPAIGDPCPEEIHKNPKLFPFFEHAVGAIDGSHINCTPPPLSRSSYRNRKGSVSQNCLFTCTFSMLFSFALTGWEGAATDARVYEDAHEHGFKPPPGKYFLADAGYPLCRSLLTPYRGTRYHLKEWGRVGIRYVACHESKAVESDDIIWADLRQRKNYSTYGIPLRGMSLNAYSGSLNDDSGSS